MENKESVITGIFWVVNGEIIADKKIALIGANNNGWIDYPYSHLRKWGVLSKRRFPNADFATFPRGRLLFNIKENGYVLYADKCIADKEVFTLKKYFGIECEPVRIANDEHYICGKCREKNNDDIVDYLFKVVLFVFQRDNGDIEVCRATRKEPWGDWYDIAEINETRLFKVGETSELINYFDMNMHYDEFHNSISCISFGPIDSSAFCAGATPITFEVTRADFYVISEAGGIENSISKDLEELQQIVLNNNSLTADSLVQLVMQIPFYPHSYAAMLDNSLNIVNHIEEYGIEGSLQLGKNLQCLFEANELNAIKTIFSAIGDVYKQKIWGLVEVQDVSNALFQLEKQHNEVIRQKVNEISDEGFSLFYKNAYTFKLSANILRGENELTGNLIEISYGGNKILVEFGKDLTNKTAQLTELEKRVRNYPYSAVVISHMHEDHAGLIDLIKTKPIYMGKTTEKLLKQKMVLNENIKTFEDGKSFSVGLGYTGITITPFLCDHSAPDSYMLLFECHGEKILYTGDFRSHGRKNFDALLSRLPKKVDTLIIEGTNANQKEGEYKIISEISIQNRLSKLLSKTDKPVFVLVPTTNIDRIVSIYKATYRLNRIMLIDKEQARKLEAFGGNVPRPSTFKSVKVYYPLPIRKKDFDNFIDLKEQSLSIADIAARNDYVMLVRTSGLSYLKKLASKRPNGLKDATLVYSMWSGYTEEESMKLFLENILELGVKVVTMHTSGHANNEAISRLVACVNPTDKINVHTS